MQRILLAIRFALFILSTVGTWEFLRRKTGINKYFIPVLTVSLQVCVLLVGGFAHLLAPAAYGLAAFGLVCALWMVWKDRDISFLTPYTDGAYAVFFLFMLALAVYEWEARFGNTDNFTHWAIVVKQMLQTNRFPNAQDALINFGSYPLGSSVYIYFWARTVSNQEPVMMLAQNFMLISAVLPLFSVVKKHKPVGIVTLVAAIYFFFAHNGYPTELLVDPLLPVFFMAALLYMRNYNLDNGNPLTFLLSAPILVLLTQIKHSGIYFAVVALILLLFGARKYGRMKLRLITGAIPLLFFAAWRVHLSISFPSAKDSTHAMTVEHLLNGFSKKSPENISNIVNKFIPAALKFKDFWLSVACLLVTGVLILLFARHLIKLAAKCGVAFLVLYVTYGIGMLGMYLFSMENYEAGYLASFDRYFDTIIDVFVYMLFALILKTVSELEKPRVLVLAVGLWAVAIPSAFIYTGSGVGTTAFHRAYSEDRIWLNYVKKKSAIPEGESYTLLTTYWISNYMLKYVFMSPDCSSIIVEDADTLGDPSEYNKYILIRDTEDPTIRAWVEKYFPDDVGKSVIVQE